MVSVKMTPDIREYSPKTFIFFTTRQALSMFVAAALGIFLFTGTGFLPVPVRFLLTLPGFFGGIMVGWYKPYGIPLEALFIHIMKNRIGIPDKRYYATTNVFWDPNDVPEPDRVERKITKKDKKALDALYGKYGAMS